MADTTTLTRTVDGETVPIPGTYTLDKSHSVVGFVARHVMVAKVRGSFHEVEGSVTVAEDPLESHVEAIVQIASLDTRDEQRDAHLRSADFFDAESHPVMTYRSTKVSPKGHDHWLVEGDLTIKDVTRPVVLDVEFNGASGDPWGGKRIGFSAVTEIDREEFGLTWNVALETGGVLVGKTIKIEIDAEAVLQA
ncbi:MAG TPA: YceI family protein [Acidimicrobiales bacterium]|nr:YceI family protein [Acidimicrobiales bacterium]